MPPGLTLEFAATSQGLKFSAYAKNLIDYFALLVQASENLSVVDI